MTPHLLLRTMAHFVRWLRAQPRRLVLRTTGEPVELLELHERAGRRHCLVELESGRQLMVTEAELDSTLAMPGAALAACGGLALAGLLVGSALGIGQGDGLIADVAACAQATRQAGDLALR